MIVKTENTMPQIDSKKVFSPNLFNVYPRAMGTPSHRKIVYNSKERDAYIKYYGRNHSIYISVYAFKKVIKDNLFETHKYARVSHLAFDFDDGNVYEEMMRFHKYLSNKNAIHRIHLSGRGFHEYEWIQENLLYPKIAMANYWDFLHGNSDGEYKNPFKPDKEYVSPQFDICRSTRGDLGQIIRIPNSYHYGVGCYCVTIDQYLINRCHSLKEFQNYAVKQYKPRGKIYFGKLRLNIKEFDCTPKQYNELPDGTLKLSYITYGDIKINHDIEVDLEDLPYCIKYMINNKPLHFRIRNEVIKFFINRQDTLIPYTPADIMGILKKIGENNRWIRWFFTHHREDIIYRNVRVVHDNINVLSGCYRINQMGFCDKGECMWKTITEKE